jgi:hypothetical protein
MLRAVPRDSFSSFVAAFLACFAGEGAAAQSGWELELTFHLSVPCTPLGLTTPSPDPSGFRHILALDESKDKAAGLEAVFCSPTCPHPRPQQEFG